MTRVQNRYKDLIKYSDLNEDQKAIVDSGIKEINGFGFEVEDDVQFRFQINGIGVEFIKSLFDCNFETGELFAKNRSRIADGKLIEGTDISRASNRNNNYLNLSISTYKVNGKPRQTFYLHQIVFFMKYGFLPTQIDHYDGDKTNNSIKNLRPVTNSINARNKIYYKNSKTGIVNVTAHYSKKGIRYVVANGLVYQSFYNMKDAIAFRNSVRETFGFMPAKDNVSDELKEEYERAIKDLAA